MAKVALKISNASDTAANAKAELAVSKCDGTQLANPAPAEVAALATAQQAFEAALADQDIKVQAAKAATELKLQKRAAMEAAYAALGRKVETLDAGDAALIEGHGYATVSAGGPVTMNQVTGLVATPGDAEGSADWMCAPQKGALYLVQTSPDVMPRVWTGQEPAKKSSGTITGLPPVTRVWVRVAAKGSHNTGAWSDPALIIVP